MRIFIFVVAALVTLVTVVRAADDILTLNNGQIVVGEITALDEKGVTVVKDEKEAKYDWGALTPRCQYEIRSDRLGEKDADGHALLAEFCLANRLFAEARAEANIAKALGFKDVKVLSSFLVTVNRSEAEYTFAKVDQLVAEESFDEAREEIRRFLKQAPPSDYTDQARRRVADLIRRRDAQILRIEEEQATAKKLEKQEKLDDRIEQLTVQVKKLRDQANTAYTEAVRYHTLGNVSRTRKNYEAAERLLLQAHRTLSYLQRLVRRGPIFDKASEQKTAIRKKLVEVYLGLAKLFCKHRNFKQGWPYLNKVLFLDPVNKEALDLRGWVDANWLRTSARRLTNTPGVRVTGGTNR